MKPKNLLPVVAISSAFLISAPTAYAKSACKELSKTACSNAASCSWTKGYTTKKGVKVSSYCRNKPGKKAKQSKTKTSKKKTSTSKAKN